MGFRLANIEGRAALVSGDDYFDLSSISDGAFSPDPMAALLRPAELAELSATLSGHEPSGQLSADPSKVGPPVPQPKNSFAVGLNYQAHADEGHAAVPDVPLVFTKFPSSLVGPTAEVHLRSDRCDYEGELVVVIGKAGKDIDPAVAWDHVVGVTVGQDISDREMQFLAKPPHFDLGKSFDTFGPIGPVLVSTDELEDRDNLQVTTLVNGEVVQDETTASLMFDVPFLVSYLSRITTLTPGDLIFTGTPEGVGIAKGVFLKDGDVITTTISGLGSLENACVRVSDFDPDGIETYVVDIMAKRIEQERADAAAAAAAPAKISGDHYLAKTFAAYGVTHFFHVPLIVPNAMKLMELPEHGIQCISAHSEKAAVYMADGYARSTGKPGICGSQGIGRSNLLSGLRDAYMARSPIIAISGGNSSSDENTDRAPYQEVDDITSFNPYTKFNTNVSSLDRLPDTVRQAFREATSGTPAPVHVQIAGLLGNITMGEMDDDDVIQSRFASAPSFRPAAEAADVVEALAALAAAERPVIVVGGGTVMSGAQDELREFANKHQIPVASSMSGKGTMLDTDPLCVGVTGLYGKETALRTIFESDLVFYVGSMTGGQVTNHWEAPFPGKKVIQLDIDPHFLGRNYANALPLLGDAKTVLRQLIDAAEPMAPRAEWLQLLAGLNAEWREQYAAIRSTDAQPIRPERVMTELSAFLPDDGILVSDTGHATTWTGQFFEFTSTDQKWIRADGSLGWGFPAALGVKCAHPDRPVVAFVGDGAFLYHLPEVETAVRYGINTITVVNNNSAVSQATPVWQGPEAERFEHHWKFGDVNYANMAREMGGFGIRVTDPNEIASALEQAAASGLPAVVEVVTDVDAMPPDTWNPNNVGSLLSGVGSAD